MGRPGATYPALRILCRIRTLQLPTARLSPTHNNLRVALLLQIMFAGVTPVPLPPQGDTRKIEALSWPADRVHLTTAMVSLHKTQV